MNIQVIPRPQDCHPYLLRYVIVVLYNFSEALQGKMLITKANGLDLNHSHRMLANQIFLRRAILATFIRDLVYDCEFDLFKFESLHPS